MDPIARRKIEEVVKEKNKTYKNQSDPSIAETFEVGRVKVYALRFKGEDGYERTNYVSDYKGELRAYDRIDQAIPEINKGLGLAYELIDNARLLLFGLLSIAVVAAIIYLLINEKKVDEKLFAIATGLFGYLAGKDFRPGK